MAISWPTLAFVVVNGVDECDSRRSGRGASPRVALVVAGSRGDAQPFVALALALQEAGAQPILMTHGEHRGLAAAHGVEFLELPGDPRELLATRAGLELLDAHDPVRALGGLRTLAADLIDDVITALEAALAQVDVVVFSTLAVAAFHVAEAHGLPAVWGVLQPVTPSREYASLLVAPGKDFGGWANLASHRLADRLAWWMLAPGLVKYRERMGLPPVRASRVRDEVLTLGGWSPLVAPRPTDWPDNVVVTGAWMLPESREARLDPRLEDFVHAGAPPVYIGLGSATVADPAAVTSMMLGAARDAGVRVVLSSGWAGLGGASAGGGSGDGVEQLSRDVILVTGDVGHQRLFARCSAVVHHAGAGTTHTALAAGAVGVPTPFWADQPFWSARTAALGVSVDPVPKRGWSRVRVARAIARAVGEPWRARRAESLGAAVRSESGATEAARRIMELAPPSLGGIA